MTILVTGTRSGLGRYLADEFDAVELSRETSLDDVASQMTEPVDAIIHCAANSMRDVPASELYGFMQDNLFLTEQLTRIPHRMFILISTIAVYPPEDIVQKEDSDLWIGDIQYAYPITKLMSEAVVGAQCDKHLILRPTAMLGENSRPNSAIRILTDDSCSLTLDGESAFNYILHRDVGKFIRICLRDDVTGTYNLASDGRVKLKDTAQQYGRSVTFGSFLYQIGTIDNTKAKAILPEFGRTSEETLRKFAKEHLGIEPVR